jgi:hypothetical protein
VDRLRAAGVRAIVLDVQFTAWIDVRGGPGTFPTVSFADLVKGPRARVCAGGSYLAR